MNNEFIKSKYKTDEIGNVSAVIEYDIAGELAHEIAARKETMWKHFCRNVCQKMMAEFAPDIAMKDFDILFTQSFESEVREWGEL